MSLIILFLIFGYLFYAVSKHPSVALVGVFCQYGVEQFMAAEYVFFYQNSAVLNIAFGLLVVWGIFQRIVGADPFKLFALYPLLGLMSIALYLYALLSGIWSPSLETGAFWGQWNAWYLYIIVNLCAAPLLLRSTEEVDIILYNLIYIGGSIAAYLLLFGEWEGRALIMQIGNADALDRQNPLAVATMGCYVTLAAVAMGRKTTHSTHRLLLIAITAVSLMFIIRTGSRGQLIAVLTAVLAVVPVVYRVGGVQKFLGMSVVALMMVAMVSLGLDQYWSTEASSNYDRFSSDSVENRVELTLDWAAILFNEAWTSVLTGIWGLGNSASFVVLGYYPHMAIPEVFAEEGLFGGLLMLAILFMAAQAARRTLSAASSDTHRYAVGFFAGILLVELIVSFKQGSLLSASPLFLSCIIVAQLKPIIERESKKNRIHARVKRMLLKYDLEGVQSTKLANA